MEELMNSSMGQAQVTISSSVTLEAQSLPIETEVVNEESKDTSTNNSIICLDDEDDCTLPDLPLCFPTNDKVEDDTSKDDKDSNDDDFCIVYENIVPLPDIQIILNNQTEQFQSSERKKKTPQTNSDSNQNESIEVINEEEIQENTFDDSICIIEDECTTSHSASVKRNRLRQVILDSAEKKKRKVECAVCFDGPDDISNSNRNLVSTLCGHIFCDECIKNAMTICKKCPQCRKKLTAKQYHPIYL